MCDYCIVFLILALLLSTDINDLFDVHYELLNVAHNWRAVGRALRLHPDLLNRIGADHSDVTSSLEGVLTEWLKREYDTSRFGLPSWGLLVSAVAHPAGGKDHALAGQIAERHNGKYVAHSSHILICTCICVIIHVLCRCLIPYPLFLSPFSAPSSSPRRHRYRYCPSFSLSASLLL